MEFGLENLRNVIFSDIFTRYFAISPPTNDISHTLVMVLKDIIIFYYILLLFYQASKNLRLY